MSLVAAVLSHLLFVYLVVGEPLVGRYCYRALQRDVATDSTARSRFFWLVIVIEWIWVATVAVVLTTRPDPLTAIGLVPMAMSPLVSGMVVGMLIGLILSTVAFAWNPGLRAGIQRQAAGVSALVPATTGERWLFVGVSLTAGVCEEIVFRGFLRLYLQDLGLPMIATGILATAIFGLCTRTKVGRASSKPHYWAVCSWGCSSRRAACCPAWSCTHLLTCDSSYCSARTAPLSRVESRNRHSEERVPESPTGPGTLCVGLFVVCAIVGDGRIGVINMQARLP